MKEGMSPRSLEPCLIYWLVGLAIAHQRLLDRRSTTARVGSSIESHSSSANGYFSTVIVSSRTQMLPTSSNFSATISATQPLCSTLSPRLSISWKSSLDMVVLFLLPPCPILLISYAPMSHRG